MKSYQVCNPVYLALVLLALLALTSLAQSALLATAAHAATVIACQDVNGSDYPVSVTNPCPVTTTPGTLVLVPLDVATVTTGGTAVTALATGHRNKGGWLLNPSGATVNLCINEQTTASGTTSAGALICIAPGSSFNLAPSPLAVSVVTSDSAHPFAGEGYN